MTDKQFNELKKSLATIQKDLTTIKSGLTSIDKNVIETFNVANITNAYVGADDGASSDSDMLPKILKAVTK